MTLEPIDEAEARAHYAMRDAIAQRLEGKPFALLVATGDGGAEIYSNMNGSEELEPVLARIVGVMGLVGDVDLHLDLPAPVERLIGVSRGMVLLVQTGPAQTTVGSNRSTHAARALLAGVLEAVRGDAIRRG